MKKKKRKAKPKIRAKQTNVFVSRHSSRRLAERHRRELERIHGTTFELTRKDRFGRFSTRGRSFTFTDTGKIVEWLVTIAVHSQSVEGQRSHERQVDFLVPAPATATDAEVFDILWSLRMTIPKTFRWILKVPDEWMDATYIQTGAAPKFKDRVMIR